MNKKGVKFIKKKIYLSSSIVFLVLTLLTTPAAGDGAMPGFLSELSQTGQDVIISIDLWEGEFNTYRITWELTNEEKILFDNYKFNKDGYEEIYTRCAAWEQSECTENEGVDCYDCEGDEFPECPEPCRYGYIFSLVHKCVPVGDIIYRLYYWGSEEWAFENEREISVTDSGKECNGGDAGADDAGSGTDSDTDSDSDSDDASQDEGAGCGVVHGAASSSELILALLMITAGLAAFRFRHS